MKVIVSRSPNCNLIWCTVDPCRDCCCSTASTGRSESGSCFGVSFLLNFGLPGKDHHVILLPLLAYKTYTYIYYTNSRVHLVSSGQYLYHGILEACKTKTIVLICHNQQSELLSTVVVKINPSSTYGINAMPAKPVAHRCQAQLGELGSSRMRCNCWLFWLL